MADRIRLNSPRLRVVFGKRSDPDSWEAVEVQTAGADMQAAEQLFAKHKEWGGPTKRPIKFQTVLAWYAMRNTGAFNESLAKFEAEALEVGDVDTDDDTDDDTGEDGLDTGEDETTVDPTRPDLGIG